MPDWVFTTVLVMLVVVSLLFLSALLGYQDWHLPKFGTSVSADDPADPTSREASQLAAAREVLFSREYTFDLRFVSTRPAAPQAICQALADADFPNSGLVGSVVRKGGRECYSLRQETVVADDPEAGLITQTKTAPAPYDLFFVLRGDDIRASQFYLKIRLADDSHREEARRRVQSLLKVLFGATGTPLPPVFLNASLNAEWAQFVQPDAVMTWEKEFGSVLIYYLTVSFGVGKGKLEIY